MTSDAVVIVQLPRGGAVDWYLRTYPPPGVASGQVVVEPVAAEPDGRLGPVEAGEGVMSVLSPEALARGREGAAAPHQRARGGARPLVGLGGAPRQRGGGLPRGGGGPPPPPPRQRHPAGGRGRLPPPGGARHRQPRHQPCACRWRIA